FGVGGVVRPGDWAGLEVTVRQLTGEPTRAAVQVHRRDPDGDTLLSRREVSLATGAERTLWIYVPVDWGLRSSDGFTVTVREMPEDATGAEVAVGEQIGAASFLANQIVLSTESLIGVVGRDTFGIEQYEMFPATGTRTERVRTGHNEFRVVSGLNPADLPDRWMGLAAFDVLVWGEGDPRQLAGGRADALMEWVRRGGHLVIVPEDINPGWLAAGNPVSGLLPDGEFTRREDVSLEQFRNLFLRPGNPIDLPQRSIGYVFEASDEASFSAGAALIEGREGALVARRIVGAGQVTVVGLDLRNRGLAGGLNIRADQFWHRIFAHRFLVPSPEDVADTNFDRRLRALRTSGGSLAMIDEYIASEINRSTAVGVGLLLGVVVFALYWILAGPGGFALLKAKNRSHLAWPVFVLATVVFSVIGWIGAKALSPAKVSGVHITFIDHVYGEPTQRTRSWISILLPDYGERTVRVGVPDDDSGFVHALMPWNSPDQPASISFPDARQYVLGTADPSELTVPTRSTVKQFRADWLGGAVWEMPIPPTPQDRPSATASGLRGRLQHNLPGPLTNVTIVLNLGQVSEEVIVDSFQQTDQRGQRSRTRTHAWRKNPAVGSGADWVPGEVLDLNAYQVVGDDRLEERLRRDLPGVGITGVAAPGTSAGISLTNWLGHIPGPSLTEITRTSQATALQR
ncbi:MAG: DUF4350 domain-containing protein, partial [Phycisphaerales bacterium]